ncbi:MAG TPA: protein-export chaperone SecB [Gammaproteobacteria bacterium]|nr:protein-export chaperone SecB [Gammaproteobacteria bacterium]
MSEQAQDTPAAKFAIQKIYVKDMSFETPNSPMIFMEQWEPEVNVQLRNTAAALNDTTQEVVLTVTVTAKLKDKVAYLIEVQQAGIFNIEGFDKDQFAAMVGSYCPNLLFPFVREVVSDVVTKGGFPQLVLAPINFDALYRQQQEQQAAQQAGEQASTH